MQAVLLITCVDGVLGASIYRNADEAYDQVRREIHQLDPEADLVGADEDRLQELACDAGLDFAIQDIGVPDVLKNLAEVFESRARHQGLKGKQRDTLLIEFMVGAYAALEAVGHPAATPVSINLATGFCLHGYKHLERILAK